MGATKGSNVCFPACWPQSRQAGIHQVRTLAGAGTAEIFIEIGQGNFGVPDACKVTARRGDQELASTHQPQGAGVRSATNRKSAGRAPKAGWRAYWLMSIPLRNRALTDRDQPPEASRFPKQLIGQRQPVLAELSFLRA